MLSGMGAGVSPASTSQRYFGSPASQYVSTQRPLDFQKAYADARAAVDYNDMKTKIQYAVKLLQQQEVAIPLFQHEADFVVSTKLVPNPGLQVFGIWDVANIWLNK